MAAGHSGLYLMFLGPPLRSFWIRYWRGRERYPSFCPSTGMIIPEHVPQWDRGMAKSNPQLVLQPGGVLSPQHVPQIVPLLHKFQNPSLQTEGQTK